MLRQLHKVLLLGYHGLGRRCPQTRRPILFLLLPGRQAIRDAREDTVNLHLQLRHEGLLHDVLVVLLRLRGDLLQEIHAERQTPTIEAYTPELSVL